MTLGNGNSPPASRLACLPFSADVRLGENLEKAFDFQRFDGRAEIQVGRKRNTLSASESVVVTGVLSEAPGRPGGENCCVEMDPVVARAEDIHAQLRADTPVDAGKPDAQQNLPGLGTST